MRIIDAYLGGALARGYLLVAAALLVLFGLFDFMEQADDVGQGTFSLLDAVAVVALNLPARLMDLSPFVALLGVVYGLSTFVRSHELIALRASGLTPLRLALLCGVSTAALFTGLAGVEWLARPMAQQAHLLQMTETSRDGTLFSREGIWLERDGTFISIASLARGGAPSGIQLYEFGNDTVLDRYVGAARADIHPESADRAARDPRPWALRQVVEKRYGVDGGVATRHYDTLDWTPPWQQNTALYELPLESLSLTDINERRRYLAAEGRASGIFDMEYWRRLLLPASGIVFSLFAAPFVLGVGPRASMGGAVTLGVGNALVMFLVQQIGTNAIYLATHSPALAVALPILAVAALATLLIRRVNGPPR